MDDNDEKYKLLNTKEVARLLFGSEEESNTKKVRRLARNGTIKHFRNGKHYLFNKAELPGATNNTSREQDNSCSRGEGISHRSQQRISTE